VLGATNDGLERIVSANLTNLSNSSFDLIALAWHHTDLSYYKFAAIVTKKASNNHIKLLHQMKLV